MITLINTQTKERTTLNVQDLVALMADSNTRKLMRRVSASRDEIVYSLTQAGAGPVFKRPVAVAQTAWGR